MIRRLLLFIVAIGLLGGGLFVLYRQFYGDIGWHGLGIMAGGFMTITGIVLIADEIRP